MSDVIFLPFPKNLYDDVVRFSDGRCDLVDLAIDQFHDFIRRTADDNAHGWFGSRLNEFLAVYHPDIISRWDRDDTANEAREVERFERRSPLVWKEVVIPAGTEVRMQYSGAYHMARVMSGKIVDAEGIFSPAEWASKVAAGTNRNAWRDLYLRLPGKSEWIVANTLRDLRRQELAALVGTDIDELLKDI